MDSFEHEVFETVCIEPDPEDLSYYIYSIYLKSKPGYFMKTLISTR